MQFLGGIEGMNFKPIAGYNSYLKNNAAFSFDSNMDFENVLNRQTQAITNPNQQVQGAVSMDMNFDDALVQSTQNIQKSSDSAGSFMGNLANSFSSGLNSVDQSVQAAHKAQEALAMGEDVSVHDVMIAAEKASLSMQMAMQVRNKILTAYNEINNVRV